MSPVQEEPDRTVHNEEGMCNKRLYHRMGTEMQAVGAIISLLIFSYEDIISILVL